MSDKLLVLHFSASSVLSQIGSLTGGAPALNSTVTTGLVKPAFGFQSPLTTSTTSSVGKIGL